MEENIECSICKYWISLWQIKGRRANKGAGGVERRSKRGRCHRHAPRASALSVQWPWTKPHDTCGDFAPRLEERRTVVDAAESADLEAAE